MISFGTGDGLTTQFALTTSGGVALLPGQLQSVSAIYAAGVQQGGDAFTVDLQSGAVTFVSAPASGAALGWDGDYTDIVDLYKNGYTALITSEHATRQKFRTLVGSLAHPFNAVQQAFDNIQNGFDLDTAVGAQLDVIGLWVGVSRQVKTPITGVYFTWGDTANPTSTGWSYGVWKGKYDPSTGVESMSDDTYRSMIRAKIAANQWDGSIPGAYAIWNVAFSGSGASLIIQDKQDMTMIVAVTAEAMSGLNKALMSQGYLPIRPAGVRIRSYRFVPANGPMFAWGISNTDLDGWGSGQWGELY